MTNFILRKNKNYLLFIVFYILDLSLSASAQNKFHTKSNFKIAPVFDLSLSASAQNKFHTKSNFKIAPVFEYMHLIQIDREDQFAPEDKGFLYGLNLNFEFFLFKKITVLGNFKYTTGILEYNGSRGTEDGGTVEEPNVRSDYYLTDLDIAIGYRFKLNKSTIFIPYFGSKFWRWNNKLDPNQDLIHEISTTKAILIGLKYNYQWNKNTATYINGSIMLKNKINTEFLFPKYDDVKPKEERSYNLTIGQIWKCYFAELKISRYKSGPGFENGNMVKTPVLINLFSFSIGYIF